MSSGSDQKPTPGSFVKDLRDWVDIAFKIILAVVGIIVGYYFSFEKQQNDDIKLIVDMVTDPAQSKRLMAASINQAYYQQKRIPQAVYLAIYSYVNSSKDSGDLQAIVNAGVSASSKSDPGLQQAVAKVSSELPVRVYMQIRQEADRTAATAIKEKIGSVVLQGGQSLIVPGIELVEGTQAHSILKCFRKVECQSLGPQLIEAFKTAGVSLDLSDQSSLYEASAAIRPKQFEVWFAKNLQ